MCDIDIANLSDRPSVLCILVLDANGLTYCQFFHHTVVHYSSLIYNFIHHHVVAKKIT